MATLSVALDVAPLHGRRTGVGVAVARLVDALAARDDVVLHRYLVSYRAELAAGEHRLALPAALAQRAWARWRRPRADRWLEGVDVVHGTNYVVPPSRLPSLVSVYDCWALAHPEAATPAVRRAGRLARQAAAEGATIVVNSSATAAAAMELLSTSRVEVIPLGAPEVPEVGDDRRPGAAPDRPFILAVATTERRKGLAALVGAFGRVAGELAEVELVLAGATGDDEPAVAAAVRDLPRAVQARVVRLGPVSDPEKWWLLRHATVLVYPSLDEGFGFPVLEAQAVGTPVVATRVGSLPEVGGTGVELVELGDIDALASAVLTVVTDDTCRRRLAAAGRHNVTRFDWATTASAFVDVYARLAAAAEARR